MLLECRFHAMMRTIRLSPSSTLKSSNLSARIVLRARDFCILKGIVLISKKTGVGMADSQEGTSSGDDL